jgi:hypothetical protein
VYAAWGGKNEPGQDQGPARAPRISECFRHQINTGTTGIIPILRIPSTPHRQRKSCQLRPGHDGNVSMSADRDIAKSEYVTDLYTVTTEVIDLDIVVFVGPFDRLSASDSVCSAITGPDLSICSSTPESAPFYSCVLTTCSRLDGFTTHVPPRTVPQSRLK